MARWRNIAAAVCSLLLAAGYASLKYEHRPLLGMGWHGMGQLMQIEFLVIHSFPFITVVALLRPSTPKGKMFRRIAFWGLLILYISGAYSMGGWWGILTFAGLTLATYLGFLLHMTRGLEILRLGFRWLVSFVLFLVLAGFTRMPEAVESWSDTSKVYAFGFYYFLILGVLEWIGFYQTQWIDQIPAMLKKGQSE
jgi:hypothetical protein